MDPLGDSTGGTLGVLSVGSNDLSANVCEVLVDEVLRQRQTRSGPVCKGLRSRGKPGAWAVQLRPRDTLHESVTSWLWHTHPPTPTPTHTQNIIQKQTRWPDIEAHT